MDEPSSPTILLHDLYQIGEEMRAALDADDLDAFFEHMEARTALIEQLGSHEAPASRPPEWQSLSEQVQRQHEELVAAIEQQRGRIDRLLNDQQRYRQAHASYQPSGQPASKSVLHRNVQG